MRRVSNFAYIGDMQHDGFGQGCWVRTYRGVKRLAEIDPAFNVTGSPLGVGPRTKYARGVLPLAADLGAPCARFEIDD